MGDLDKRKETISFRGVVLMAMSFGFRSELKRDLR